jgi:hypothetical protein
MKKLLAIAVLVAACGGATDSLPSGSITAFAAVHSPAPSAVPVVAAATPTSSPSPSPTPDPEAIRKTAATAYLAVAKAANKAGDALDKKYKTFGTVKRARAYFKAAAKIEGDFIAGVKNLVVPADTSGDLHALVVKDTALQSLYIEGSAAKSWASVYSVSTAAQKASRAASAAANLIRSDLGLPPVPA